MDSLISRLNSTRETAQQIESGMAAVYTKSQLLVMQMPKTGCIWRIHALLRAGLGRPRRLQLPRGHDVRHAVLAQIPEEYRDYFTIGCVRRPDAWLKSYWMMRVARRNWHDTWPTWMPDVFLDRDCQSDSFVDFVNRYLDTYPGLISRLAFDYVGNGESEIDFVCRQEYLAEELCLGLRAAGIPFDEKALHDVPRRNAARNRTRRQAHLPDHLLEKINAAERPLIERFYPGQ